MNSPKKFVTTWLEQPHDTNRDALKVGLVGGVLTFVLLWLAGQALEAADAIDFGDTIKLWLAASIAGAALALGVMLELEGEGRPTP